MEVATLTTELQQAIAAALKDNPRVSNRQLAERFSCDPKVVRRVRAALEQSGEIPPVETVVDSLGRAQAAKNEVSSLSVPEPVALSVQGWQERIAALETECAALEEELASLREQREKALTAAATGNVTARETLAQLAVKLATKEASLRNMRDMLAAARRGLEEAEAREEAERREAKRAELEALSQERLAAARAVDEALEKLAAAIVAYKRVCEQQARLAPEAGMGRRPFEFNEYVLSEAASTHLYRLLPELQHVAWDKKGPLVEKDAITRALVEGGGAA